ncbi:MAG: TfoX/Sxy family protein [Nocardioidaceae bacterium]
MAYDEQLAQRLRDHLDGEAGLTERAMFGGLAFLIGGNMAVAASGQGGLMLRVGPGQGEALLAEPHVEPVVMRGREMTGWLRIDLPALESGDDLARWADLGVAFARSLPAK